MNMWFSARLYQQAIFHSNACGVPYYCTRRAILQSNRAPHYISRRAPSSNHTGAIYPQHAGHHTILHSGCHSITRRAPFASCSRMPYFCMHCAIFYALGAPYYCTPGATLQAHRASCYCTQEKIILLVGRYTIARGAPHATCGQGVMLQISKISRLCTLF